VAPAALSVQEKRIPEEEEEEAIQPPHVQSSLTERGRRRGRAGGEIRRR